MGYQHQRRPDPGIVVRFIGPGQLPGLDPLPDSLMVSVVHWSVLPTLDGGHVAKHGVAPGLNKPVPQGPPLFLG